MKFLLVKVIFILYIILVGWHMIKSIWESQQILYALKLLTFNEST